MTIHLKPGMVVSVPTDRDTPAHTVRLLTEDEQRAIVVRIRAAINAPEPR